MTPIYLDNNATTACDPAVVEAMLPYFTEQFGNASSMHSFGNKVAQGLKEARVAVQKLIGAEHDTEIVFTSCGTEFDSTAILSALKAQPERNQIITTVVEHPAILALCEHLEKEGAVVHRLKVDKKGRLDLDEYKSLLSPRTAIVSVMWANNETGTLFPVEQMAAMARTVGAMFHTDAVQAVGKVPIDLAQQPIDLMSLSAHKIYGPKGIGALYLSDRLVQAFRPPYLGGEQERGLRPGTENLPYAMGLAAAATRLAKTMKSRDTAMKALNQRLRDGLKAFPEVELNSPENAVPEVLNFSENCIKSETMLAHLAQQQVYVSSASACGRGQPSHTLAAMGRDPLAIDTAIRVSFCADNTPEDVDAFLNAFEDGMKHLQRIRR